MEFAAVLRRLKPGTSPGLDSIFPEFILHTESAFKSWFCDFPTSCLHQLKIPDIWRRELIVVIPKPEKPLGDPKGYRPISLLCVPFKILERLNYARVDPIIDALLFREQVGFRHWRSAVDQAILLTQSIKDSYSAKKKARAVFVDLTAAYDTVWYRRLTCKVLRLLPDIHMVRMIMEMVGKINHKNETLKIYSEHKYLGVTCWTGSSRIADTSSHFANFAKSWHHASRSWDSLLALAGVLEQQSYEQSH